MIVTGEGLVPDCSGNYEVGGLYAGQTYYQRCDLAYYIWWDGLTYSLSAVLGVPGAASWDRFPNGGPVGDYAPAGAAEGQALVTAA